ncbi:hypothetical protein [Bradyrhizobium sp. BR 10289]|uniref:hypothetical protein n=1 Tax=Bradyrhizobium sp. BR 10289 TaxID=2749993 RepID=UPI001C64EB9D|nr:hypothetical protein [Bradyrhizobium sp. BR 10289]MBW7968776.1 hypothetical protein [Bradyrhizobium sp. BR 10289]
MAGDVVVFVPPEIPIRCACPPHEVGAIELQHKEPDMLHEISLADLVIGLQVRL